MLYLNNAIRPFLFQMLSIVVILVLSVVTVSADSDPYAYNHAYYDYGPDYTQYYYSVPAYDYYGGYAKTDYNRYPGGVYWNLNEYGPGYSNYQTFEQNIAAKYGY